MSVVTREGMSPRIDKALPPEDHEFEPARAAETEIKVFIEKSQTG